MYAKVLAVNTFRIKTNNYKQLQSDKCNTVSVSPLLHLRSLVSTRASEAQIQGQPPQATRVPPALLPGPGHTQVRDTPWRRCLPLTEPPESRPGQPLQGPAAVAGRRGGQRRPTWARPPAARLRGLAGGGVAFQLAGRTPSRAGRHLLSGSAPRPSSSCTSGVCRGLKRHYACDGRSASHPEMGGAALLLFLRRCRRSWMAAGRC